MAKNSTTPMRLLVPPALQQRATGWLGLILALAVLLALGGSSAQRVKAAAAEHAKAAAAEHAKAAAAEHAKAADAVAPAVSTAPTPTTGGAGTRQAGSGSVFSRSDLGALSLFGLRVAQGLVGHVAAGSLPGTATGSASVRATGDHGLSGQAAWGAGLPQVFAGVRSGDDTGLSLDQPGAWPANAGSELPGGQTVCNPTGAAKPCPALRATAKACTRTFLASTPLAGLPGTGAPWRPSPCQIRAIMAAIPRPGAALVSATSRNTAFPAASGHFWLRAQFSCAPAFCPADHHVTQRQHQEYRHNQAKNSFAAKGSIMAKHSKMAKNSFMAKRSNVCGFTGTAKHSVAENCIQAKDSFLLQFSMAKGSFYEPAFCEAKDSFLTPVSIAGRAVASDCRKERTINATAGRRRPAGLTHGAPAKDSTRRLIRFIRPARPPQSARTGAGAQRPSAGPVVHHHQQTITQARAASTGRDAREHTSPSALPSAFGRALLRAGESAFTNTANEGFPGTIEGLQTVRDIQGLRIPASSGEQRQCRDLIRAAFAVGASPSAWAESVDLIGIHHMLASGHGELS